MDAAETKVTVRLVPDLWRRVRLESVRRGIPAAKLVAEALRDWLDKNEGK